MPHPVYMESEPQGVEFVICVSVKFHQLPTAGLWTPGLPAR